MTRQPKLFSQRDAANYLTERGYPIHESQLSLMGKRGDGPRFQRVGTTKVFTQSDLDAWIESESDNPKSEEEGMQLDRGKPAGGV